MREIYLVRHGETDWNNQRIAMGQRDIPLNDLGIRQAQLTAERLFQVKLDRIYSSDLSRASETARIISEPHGLEVVIDSSLREIHLKGLEAFPDHELRAQFPHAYQIFGDESTGSIRKPHAETETRFDLLVRASQTFDLIWADRTWKVAAIVCHGGVIRCLINHVFQIQSNLTDGIFYSLGVTCDNCSLSLIQEDANEQPFFRVINDICHLSALPNREAG